jgi:glucokinase
LEAGLEQYIGIDIGGTETKGVRCTGDGAAAAETRMGTDTASGAEGVLRVVRAVLDSLVLARNQVSAVGIGTAGRVNASTGDIIYATENLSGWMGLNLPHALGLDVPVFVDNDANAALLGEHWLGAARGSDSVVMLTLGTGVGGANMLGGVLARGATWNGGEWGHVILVPDGLPCNCGNRGCAEQYLSGGALTRAARAAVSPSIRHGSELWALRREGSEAAAAVVEGYLEKLALFLYNIHTGINPGRIVIGGGVIESRDAFWDALGDKLKARGVSVPVVPALLGNRAGSLGAARLAIDGLRGVGRDG